MINSDWSQELSILKEELGNCAGGSYPAARLLELTQAEDQQVLEDAFAELDRCRVALDVSSLPKNQPGGNDALRLKQEAEFQTLDQITVGLDVNDPLVLYLQELSQMPAAGDVQACALRYRRGETELAERIMNLCLGLVADIALEFTGYGIFLMDLIQEGNMALWECILSYEDGDFQMHAAWFIRQSMAKAVTMNAYISGVGKLLREDMEAYLAADRQLLGELGRNPTRQELAVQLGMDLSELAVVEKLIEDAKAQDTVKKQTQEPEKTPEDDQAVEDTAYFQLRQRVADLLSVLPEREAKLLTLRFGLEGGQPLSPEQAGIQLGMTPAEVVAAEAAALVKLRNES